LALNVDIVQLIIEGKTQRDAKRLLIDFIPLINSIAMAAPTPYLFDSYKISVDLLRLRFENLKILYP
jgi:hypothetical protein